MRPLGRCYLAGPMRGIDQFNFPAFFDARDALLSDCYADSVESPADHDVEIGFDYKSNSLDGFDLKASLLWDFEQVMHCDTVVVLPDYEKSTGVAAEIAVARATGKRVVSYPMLLEIEPDSPKIPSSVLAKDASSMTGHFEKFVNPYEVRVTSATGGQKGQKDAQLGAIDPQAILEVAKVAGYGTKKYARYNYLRGYDWSLAFDACQRHLLQFWSGEDRDEESGLPHVAHAAWHCLAMLSFLSHSIGTDDRPNVG